MDLRRQPFLRKEVEKISHVEQVPVQPLEAVEPLKAASLKPAPSVLQTSELNWWVVTSFQCVVGLSLGKQS